MIIQLRDNTVLSSVTSTLSHFAFLSSGFSVVFLRDFDKIVKNVYRVHRKCVLAWHVIFDSMVIGCKAQNHRLTVALTDGCEMPVFRKKQSTSAGGALVDFYSRTCSEQPSLLHMIVRDSLFQEKS